MRPFLSNYHIKLLAAILMVIDHVGNLFFPSIYAFRAVGRLSFPLFAWLLTRGEAHTHNIRHYGLRLLVLGAISQPIYYLAFQVQQLNILFLLLVGLACLRLSRIVPEMQWLVWLGVGIGAELFRLEYGLYGILVIALLRYPPTPLWWLAWGFLHGVFLFAAPDFGQFQLPAIAAPLIIMAATEQQGGKARWFYWFYPGHLLVLFLIHQVLMPMFQ